MTEPGRSGAVRAQPLIVVADVGRSSLWYQRVLGAASGHGGDEYEQILVGGELVLQIHSLEVGHHHGELGNREAGLGNGVLLWFAVDDFDGAVGRIREAGADIVTDVHVNPNAGQREIWLRDDDGYAVVLSEARGAQAGSGGQSSLSGTS
jgi:predicted enzyme related to lactoylglutathione lyase